MQGCRFALCRGIQIIATIISFFLHQSLLLHKKPGNHGMKSASIVWVGQYELIIINLKVTINHCF